MALPEIPDSWSKFINTLLLAVITVLAALGYSKSSQVESGQMLSHQKLDAVQAKQDINAAKIEATAEKTDRIMGRMK